MRLFLFRAIQQLVVRRSNRTDLTTATWLGVESLFHLTILRIFIRWNYASTALLLCLARASLFLLIFPIRARSFPRWFLCNWFSLLLLFFLCLPCTRRRTQHCDAIKIVPIDDISAALARVGAQESKIINYIEAKKSWTLFEIESSFALLLWTHHKLLNYRESSQQKKKKELRKISNCKDVRW